MDLPVTAKTALLQALVSSDGYGLELIDRVLERTDGRIKLHQGSIYPALRSLEREGLVKSYARDATPERGGRPRRYYALTADGLRAAQNDRDTLLALFQEGWVPA